MEEIFKLLGSQSGQQLISGASSQLGIENNQVQNVLAMALPALLSGLNKNTNQPGGAEALMGALSNHDGSILDNVMGFLGQGNFTDGQNILGHILGGSQSNVENAVSQSTGVSSSNVAQIMAMAAPLLLGLLSKETKQNNLDANGLSNMLTNIVGGATQSNQEGMSMIEKLIDQDGDGSVMDDVSSIGMSLFQNFMK